MLQGETKIACTDRKLLVFCEVHLIYCCHCLGTQKYADVTRVGGNTNMKEEQGIVREELDWSVRNGIFFYTFQVQGYS